MFLAKYFQGQSRLRRQPCNSKVTGGTSRQVFLILLLSLSFFSDLRGRWEQRLTLGWYNLHVDAVSRHRLDSLNSGNASPNIQTHTEVNLVKDLTEATRTAIIFRTDKRLWQQQWLLGFAFTPVHLIIINSLEHSWKNVSRPWTAGLRRYLLGLKPGLQITTRPQYRQRVSYLMRFLVLRYTQPKKGNGLRKTSDCWSKTSSPLVLP